MDGVPASGHLAGCGVRCCRRPGHQGARGVGQHARCRGRSISGPLFLPLLFLAHPNDLGMDFGRAMVAFLLLFLLPVNVRIGAQVVVRVAGWNQNSTQLWNSSGAAPRAIARWVGVGVLATAAAILWRACLEASPEPSVAYWEFVHRGILPAIPVAIVGATTFAFPSRLPAMCGALLGVVPALLCSSLFVDPDPGNHGQTPAALGAYSLPVTLPITVGLGVLMAERIVPRLRDL